MTIKDLFQSDIYRTINGVVYADKHDKEIVWQELDEYVITKELMKYFNMLFRTYSDSLEKPDASGTNGVWISGFFGSGKSHFLKILSYLFENHPISKESKTKSPIDFFNEKITDTMAFGTIEKAVKSPTEVILFNIDSLSFQNDDQGALLKAFYGVFNRKRGYCFAYPHVAHVEQFLNRKGAYNNFKVAFESINGSEWHQEREDYVFHTPDIIKAIGQALPNQAENKQLVEWITNGEKAFPLTIEGFAQLVSDYIEEKGRRVLFMVDEMGQFIGSRTDRMLNLQTIVENLGTKTRGKAWVIVTSQEDIDAVLDTRIQSKGNDFSKIQARFYTRLTLSSSGIAEVIQKRLLRKKTDVTGALEALYKEKRDILLNQLSFSTDTPTMATFESAEDFTASYPFVPYQFNLVQDIFDIIRAIGATGLNLSRGERSMLDAFQSALKKAGNENQGVLIPLHYFYPTVQSFLDTSVAKSIYNAFELGSLKDQDRNLLVTLFLIRYLRLRKIKGTSHNLSVLMLDKVDMDMIRLKRQVEESLIRLEKENLINKQNDEFFFLTMEEQTISREIRAIQLPPNSEIRELAGFIFGDCFDGKTKYPHTNGKTFDLQLILDGFSRNNRGEFTVELISPLSGNEYENKKANPILASAGGKQVLIILPDNYEYYKELRLFLQTKTFLENRGTQASTPGEENAIAQKSSENSRRRNTLISQSQELIVEARTFCVGSEINPASKGGPAFLMEVSKSLVDTVYSKLNMLSHPAENWEGMVKNILTMSDSMFAGAGPETRNPNALAEIREFLELNEMQGKTLAISEYVRRYAAAPFGWPDGNVQVLLAFMLRFDEIRFMKGGSIAFDKAVDCLVKSSMHDGVMVVKNRVASEEEINAAKTLAGEVFSEFPPSSVREIADSIRRHFNQWDKGLSDNLRTTEHDPDSYPGIKEMKDIKETIKLFLSITQNTELIKTFSLKGDEIKSTSDMYRMIDEFYSTQISAWRNARQLMNLANPNRATLSKDKNIDTAFKTTSEILGMRAPYKRVKDLAPAVKLIGKAIEESVGNARKGLKVKIEQYRELISPICKELALSPEDIYNVKQKLNHLYNQAEQESNIAQLELMTNTLVEKAYDDAITVLQGIRKSRESTTAGKSVRIIKLVDEAPSKDIRNTADIDELVDALRSSLKDILAKGFNIRLE